eukprot:7953269-Pyramimonas_sp.AAC.1
MMASGGALGASQAGDLEMSRSGPSRVALGALLGRCRGPLELSGEPPRPFLGFLGSLFGRLGAI